MFLIFTTGIALWLVYGLFVRDIPLIAANGVTLLLSGTILWQATARLIAVQTNGLL